MDLDASFEKLSESIRRLMNEREVYRLALFAISGCFVGDETANVMRKIALEAIEKVNA